MSKYQDALNSLNPNYIGEQEYSWRKATEILQELVDKETPRNVSALGKVDGIMQGACPNCGKPNPYSNFTVRCSCCGQRINFVRSEE